jgi:DNA-binding NarL/FixJ family response regulator
LVVNARQSVPGDHQTPQAAEQGGAGLWREVDASAVHFQEDVLSITEVQEVSASGEAVEGLVAPELLAVAEAAGERLRAETDEEPAAADDAAQALLSAATSAMGGGYSLSEIAGAEARGKEEVKRTLAGDALKRVERTGRQARDARAEHHRAIARAMRLGLSTREIAVAADVTHGTIRAIANRMAVTGASADLEGGQPGEDAEAARKAAVEAAIEKNLQ